MSTLKYVFFIVGYAEPVGLAGLLNPTVESRFARFIPVRWRIRFNALKGPVQAPVSDFFIQFGFWNYAMCVPGYESRSMQRSPPQGAPPPSDLYPVPPIHLCLNSNLKVLSRTSKWCSDNSKTCGTYMPRFEYSSHHPDVVWSEHPS
jgi:hypothetical protein